MSNFTVEWDAAKAAPLTLTLDLTNTDHLHYHHLRIEEHDGH